MNETLHSAALFLFQASNVYILYVALRAPSSRGLLKVILGKVRHSRTSVTEAEVEERRRRPWSAISNIAGTPHTERASEGASSDENTHKRWKTKRSGELCGLSVTDNQSETAGMCRNFLQKPLFCFARVQAHNMGDDRRRSDLRRVARCDVKCAGSI